jgi:2-dehydro-3-deoxygluconokinase
MGAEGAVVSEAPGVPEVVVPVPERVVAVDTSAAGDSFNAGYLASRMKGSPAYAAVLAGHRLAGVVVQHRGAIAPREATFSVARHDSPAASRPWRAEE